jgi:hypothetical protein
MMRCSNDDDNDDDDDDDDDDGDGRVRLGRRVQRQAHWCLQHLGLSQSRRKPPSAGSLFMQRYYGNSHTD